MKEGAQVNEGSAINVKRVYRLYRKRCMGRTFR